MVAFEDGTIYFYTKELPNSDNKTTAELERESIQVSNDSFIPRIQITKKMQDYVEGYNFDKCYKKIKPSSNIQDSVSIIVNNYYSEMGCINMTDIVYNKRHLNFVTSKWATSPKKVNPFQILRFDTNLINDMYSFKAKPDEV